MKRIKLIAKIGGKALPHLGGIGKITGGILHLRHHRDDGPSTDRAGKPAKTVNGLIIRGMSLNIKFGAKVTVINSVTAERSLLLADGGCKEYTSKYKKTGYGNSTTKTTTMTRAMRTSMRPTTA